MRGQHAWLALFIAIALMPTGVIGEVTEETYHRAEAFLPWNIPELVSNASVDPHWVGNGNRFWYRRETSAGHEFILVDADADKQEHLFDHKKVARALSEATGESHSGEALPFKSFHLDPEANVIRFDLDGQGWKCSLARDGCVELDRALDLPGESRSPDGQWSVFVRENDLFARSEASGNTVRLTRDGERHQAYATPLRTVIPRLRGARPDPIVAWGPDSRRLLTQRVDERDVGEMHLLQTVPAEDQYRPRLHSYRYPLSGDPVLPTASLYVVHPEEETVTRIESEPLLLTTPFSPIGVGQQAWWSRDENEVYFLDYARGRKAVALKAADATTGEVRTLVTEQSEARIDLNVFHRGRPNVRVLAGGDEVIWFSERDGWGQLYLYDGETGELENRITDGSFVVRDIQFIDTDDRLIYFTASGVDDQRDPYFRHLYRAPLDGGEMTLLTPEHADHSIEFSPDGRYFVDNHFWGEQRDRPVAVLRSADGEVVRQLEQGSLAGLEATGAGLPERISVKAADGETDLYGFLYRPADFDPERSYPVVEWIYEYPQIPLASPGIGTAGGQLRHFLPAQSVAELGFVVVAIDGRGTAWRSRTFHDVSQGRLWQSRLKDHPVALRQLGERYPFLDLERVGVYGHSGGGTATVRLMLEHPDVYKVGVSSSGSQDPRDSSAVAELYQGYPVDEETWNAQANWRLAEELEGKLLLAQGELDNHLGQIMRLVNALIAADRDFDMLLIPNRGHGLDTDPYFIGRRWDYFVRHLLGEEPPAHYSIDKP